MSTLSRATGTTRERRARDYYPTIDPRAAAKLVPHLRPAQAYVEPCAGGGHNSTDDCSWYLFDARHQGATEYVWPAPVRDTAQMELI